MLCVISLLSSAQNITDSLLTVIKEAPDSVALVDAINELAYELRMSNPDSTLLLTRQSEAIAQSINYPLGEADAKMRMAIANTGLGNYYLALKLFLEAQVTFDESGDKNRIAGNLNNIGRIYNFIEENDMALSYFERSAVLYAAIGNLSREGDILNNIGYIYKLKGEYEKALEYLHRSRIRSFDSPNREGPLYPSYNIGSAYMRMDEYDSAFKYLNQAEELPIQLKGYF